MKIVPLIVAFASLCFAAWGVGEIFGAGFSLRSKYTPEGRDDGAVLLSIILGSSSFVWGLLEYNIHKDSRKFGNTQIGESRGHVTQSAKISVIDRIKSLIYLLVGMFGIWNLWPIFYSAVRGDSVELPLIDITMGGPLAITFFGGLLFLSVAIYIFGALKFNKWAHIQKKEKQ